MYTTIVLLIDTGVPISKLIKLTNYNYIFNYFIVVKLSS